MGAMIGTPLQQQVFKDRLSRISTGGVNTTHHVYIGPVEEAVSGKKTKGHAVKENGVVLQGPSFIGQVLRLPIALAAGALAVLGGRAAEFHLPQLPIELPPEVLDLAGMGLLQVPLALIALAVLRAVFRLNSPALYRAALAGALAMFLFEPGAVAKAPEVFGLIYSEAHVADVLTGLSRTDA